MSKMIRKEVKTGTVTSLAFTKHGEPEVTVQIGKGLRRTIDVDRSWFNQLEPGDKVTLTEEWRHA